ncbi:MAG: BON domain-containing protein [Pseudomonadota bacterium]
MYTGSITLFGLALSLLLMNAYGLQKTIEIQVQNRLAGKAWLQSSVRVDGRDVHLVGEVDPSHAIDDVIQHLTKIDGVRSVSNRLEGVVQPDPDVQIRRFNDQVVLTGNLTGENLDTILSELELAFPNLKVHDTVSIDDRLANPIWLTKLREILIVVRQLPAFSLSGWHRQIVLNGTADDANQINRIGFSLAATVPGDVIVENRLRARPGKLSDDILLTYDWNGVSLIGRVADESTAQFLTHIVKRSFQDEVTSINLEVTNIDGRGNIEFLFKKIVPAIRYLHDVQLQTSGDGIAIWGRADNPRDMGLLVSVIEDIEPSYDVHNDVTINSGKFASRISLFSDGSSAILSGKVPSAAVREKLISAVTARFNGVRIVSELDVEPNTASHDWIDKWPDFLDSLPDGVIGLSIDENNVLLTGKVDSESKRLSIQNLVLRELPSLNSINWLSTP